jgi:hypothetical protein
MALVRGCFVPQRESSGLAKKTFDVLLWLNAPSHTDLATLDIVQLLRDYLLSESLPRCEVNFYLPETFLTAAESLSRSGIRFRAC